MHCRRRNSKLGSVAQNKIRARVVTSMGVCSQPLRMSHRLVLCALLSSWAGSVSSCSPRHSAHPTPDLAALRKQVHFAFRADPTRGFVASHQQHSVEIDSHGVLQFRAWRREGGQRLASPPSKRATKSSIWQPAMASKSRTTASRLRFAVPKSVRSRAAVAVRREARLRGLLWRRSCSFAVVLKRNRDGST